MTPVLTIKVGTHFFEVQPNPHEPLAKEQVYKFVRRFIKITIMGNSKTVTVFAAANKSRTKFRFHFNTLKEFLEQLSNAGISKDRYTITYLPEPDVPECELKIKPGWEYRDYQVPVAEYLQQPIGVYDIKTKTWNDGYSRARFVGLDPGRGKAQPLSAQVRLPGGGYKTMGEITIGDQVLTPKGEATTVTGVYPQGEQTVYRLKFSDERSTKACAEHLWKYTTDAQNPEWKIDDTQELSKLLKYGQKVYFPTIQAEAQSVSKEALIERLGSSCDVVPVDNRKHGLELQEQIRSLGGTAKLFRDGNIQFLEYDLTDDKLLELTSIRKAGTDQVQCIRVEDPEHMYVTDEFIPTHNTMIALTSMAKLKYKFVVIVLAQYVPKWVKDIQEVLEVSAKEILAVKGGDAMKNLTAMTLDPKSMDPYKAIVISNRTFDMYIKAYEEYGSEISQAGYDCAPDELWQKLGIGIRLIDEVHQHFHANFRFDLYTNIKHAYSLSATLLSRDPLTERFQKIAYPPMERYAEKEIVKYIESVGVMYRINPRWEIKTSYRGLSAYNNNAFEDSLLKYKSLSKAFCEMVADQIQAGYIRYYRPGNKCIVFCSTVDMCTHMAKFLQEKFKDKNVKRYVSADPYQEHYLDPDIRVTTIGSGGTGHDIKGLTDLHLTVAVDSPQAVLQAFGRLRKIEDQSTRCYFYTWEDSPKHMNYHRNKVDLLKQRAKSYHEFFYKELATPHWVT